MLDVRRVHVDASDDDHVVPPAAQAADPRRRPAAAARLEDDGGDVARAVAKQRHRLLAERREDELALCALVERRAGLRIDDLDEEVVLVDVEAVALLEALGRDAGAAHLGESVEVDRSESRQRTLDLLAQPLGPGLAAEQAELELQGRRIDPGVLHGLRDHQRVRGRRDEHLSAEVVEEHRLPSREAAGGRNDRRADPLGPLMEAVAAGEEPVRVRVVHEHSGPNAGERHAPRHQLRPGVEVGGRVADHRRLAVRSARSVEAREGGHGHPQQPEGIRLPEPGLVGERKRPDLPDRVELDPEGCAQALELQRAQLRPRQLLGGAPDHRLRGGARGRSSAARGCARAPG